MRKLFALVALVILGVSTIGCEQPKPAPAPTTTTPPAGEGDKKPMDDKPAADAKPADDKK